MFPPNPLNEIWYKLVRKNAPETSVEAAKSIDTTMMEEVVLEEIKRFPNGCIADQVLNELPAYAYSSVTARFSALAKKGLIEYTGEKRPGRSRRNQRVMKAV